MIPIREVRISVFVHESESEEKVKEALSFLFPNVKFERKVLEGPFGTKIVEFLSSLKKKREIKDLVNFIFNNLEKNDIDYLLLTLERRMEENGNFYFRLSKYKALEGKVSLDDEKNSIQVILSFESYPASFERYLSVAKAFLESFINSH